MPCPLVSPDDLDEFALADALIIEGQARCHEGAFDVVRHGITLRKTSCRAAGPGKPPNTQVVFSERLVWAPVLSAARASSAVMGVLFAKVPLAPWH